MMLYNFFHARARRDDTAYTFKYFAGGGAGD